MARDPLISSGVHIKFELDIESACEKVLRAMFAKYSGFYGVSERLPIVLLGKFPYYFSIGPLPNENDK